jgi:hypothetical protein
MMYVKGLCRNGKTARNLILLQKPADAAHYTHILKIKEYK